MGLHIALMIVAGEEWVFKCRSKETLLFRRGHKDGQFGDCPFHSGGLLRPRAYLMCHAFICTYILLYTSRVLIMCVTHGLRVSL